MTRQQRYFKNHPWARYVMWSRRRCTAGADTKWWPFYGAKGVKSTLTMAEARILWERDGAAAMQKPSLDRIDGNGHYEFSNCRFIEWFANVRLPHLGGELAAEVSELGAGFS